MSTPPIFEDKPTVYIAGKIAKNDFRHDTVPNLREREWHDGPIDAGVYSYIGPFFKSCDHGCNHGPNQHGAYSGIDGGESPYTRHDVIKNNNEGLARADIVFAYITSLDCFGTLVELGYALRAAQRVILAFAPGVPDQDLWYVTHQAFAVHRNVRPCCLRSLIRDAVREFDNGR